MDLDNLDNQELIQATKDIHGSLYKRINHLQRALNIKSESLKRAIERIEYLEKNSTSLVPKSKLMEMFSQFIDDYRDR